jgi:hypothetical protein
VRIRNQKKPNMKAKVPSGLISGWQSKLPSHPSQPVSKVKPTASFESDTILGGLEDEDASADISATLAVSKGRYTGRKNDVCCFRTLSDPDRSANLI